MPPHAPALTTLSRTFRAGTEDLARELCEVCRPLLPADEAGLFRTDQLGLVAGLESDRPLVASALALAPAVSAAGDAICVAALAGGERTALVLAAAQPVAELAGEALRLVRRPHPTAEVVGFAHRLALGAHRAADLFSATERRRGLPPRRRRSVSALWAPLLEGLDGRIRRARELAAAEDPGPWPILVDAAEACRDGGLRAVSAYDSVAGRGGPRPRSRLLRSLAFANLYCGFAALRDLPRGSAPSGLRIAGPPVRRWTLNRRRSRAGREARCRSAPAAPG